MRLPLKILIFATIGLTLLGAFVPNVQEHLTLSWTGIKQFYLWQLITYIFVEPGPFSFNQVITLGFNMYVLWIFGLSMLERCHPGRLLAIYLGAALVSGLTALAFPNVHLSGSTNPVYALLVAWMILNPGAQLLLFFKVPLKAEWLILGLLAFTLFLDLSASQWVWAATLAASVLYSYLFSIIAFKEMSPFPFLRPFERRLLRLFEPKKTKPYQHSKIYDFKSGAPILGDDQFMDAMLEKITRLGESALTPEEKKRMKEISEKKR